MLIPTIGDDPPTDDCDNSERAIRFLTGAVLISSVHRQPPGIIAKL